MIARIRISEKLKQKNQIISIKSIDQLSQINQSDHIICSFKQNNKLDRSGKINQTDKSNSSINRIIHINKIRSSIIKLFTNRFFIVFKSVMYSQNLIVPGQFPTR